MSDLLQYRSIPTIRFFQRRRARLMAKKQMTRDDWQQYYWMGAQIEKEYKKPLK